MAVRFGLSYFGVRDVRHARADLDEIAEAGFAAVTHTFSEHDLRYHVEDVGRLVEETRARGLEAALDPWGVAGLFGGEAYSELALVDLACRQIDAAGRSVPAACPNAPATRALLRRWARAAAGLGADVLFWDEPHFHLGALLPGPSEPCCRCSWCERAWAACGHGGPLPPEGDARLARFRTESLRAALEEALEVVPTSVRQALCLLPRGEHATAGTDDWETFARIDRLDRLATDPYWMDRAGDRAAFVRAHAEALRRVCHQAGREAEVWIQGVRISAGEERAILAGVEAAVEAGVERIAFWSYRGTGAMSSLACGDPEAAWEAMREAVRRFGG